MRTLLLFSLLAGVIAPLAAQDDGIVAWYRFDEGRGVSVADATGAHPASTVGDAFWTPSPWGTALRLSGDAHVVGPRADALNPADGLWLEAMVRWDADPGEHEGKVDELGAVIGNRRGATGYLLAVHREGSGRRASVVINGLRDPERRMLTSEVSVPAGEWTWLAASYDGRMLRLWVNETMAERRFDQPAIIAANPDPLALATEYPGSPWYHFRGAIDEVRIGRDPFSPETALARYRELRAAAQPVADGAERPAQVEARTEPWVVAQDGSGDFNGDTDEPIRAAIEAARGGGTVLIRSGVYTIHRTLQLDQAAGVTLRGEDGAVLTLPPLPHSTLDAAEKGATTLTVRDAALFRPGKVLCIEAPGRANEHAGRVTVSPTFNVRVAAVDGRTLTLAEPLPYPVPAGAAIAGTDNLFEMRSGGDVTVEGLTLDGAWREGDPTFVGHVQLCTFLAHGPYSYTAGLTGEPIRGLRIHRCVFRNVHGRPIAWYAVHDSSITDCVIERSRDAGIDIDHFCERLTVTGNQIRDCPIGVEINDGSHCTVAHNVIERCERGITIWRWCDLPGLNTGNALRANVIRDPRGAGIEIGAECEGNVVVDNTVTGTATPVVNRGEGNRVEGNGAG